MATGVHVRFWVVGSNHQPAHSADWPCTPSSFKRYRCRMDNSSISAGPNQSPARSQPS